MRQKSISPYFKLYKHVYVLIISKKAANLSIFKKIFVLHLTLEGGDITQIIIDMSNDFFSMHLHSF